MKLAFKFSAWFWIIVISAVVYSCSPNPAHAADKSATFDCTGERITMTQEGHNPVIMSIAREKGTWMQLPLNGTGPKTFTLFYNLDSGKVAKVGKNYAGVYHIEFFKDVDYANAFKPERVLKCQLGIIPKYKP